jgi:hypothetical protein
MRKRVCKKEGREEGSLIEREGERERQAWIVLLQVGGP